jgi:hypothetical protein
MIDFVLAKNSGEHCNETLPGLWPIIADMYTPERRRPALWLPCCSLMALLFEICHKAILLNLP